jgi:hypothetical protein
MSDGAEEDATDIQNLIAERDELLQKLQEETEEREQISQERDELLAATSGSDNMVQLKDAFSKRAAEKEMLENELQEARVVHNLLRYTANKLTSKSYSATTMPAAMAMAQSEPVTNPLAASRRSSKVIPETTNPFGFEEIKPEVPLRKYSSTKLGVPVEVGASSRSSKVIPDELGLDATNNEVLVRRISSIKPESIPVEARASKRSTVLAAKMRTSTILPEQGLGNGAPPRQVSALGPGITAETMQMYTTPDKKQKKCCPRDLRDLETDIDRKQHNLDFAEFSIQKTIDNCGKMRSTHEKQCTTDPSASQLQGNTSVEFTHFKIRTPVGAPSKIVTFGTSGTLRPQLTEIGHQVRQNLPQIVLQELGKIVRSFPSQIPFCLLRSSVQIEN